MEPGAYDACLHDKPLPDVLATLAGLGLTGAEIDSGGFLSPVHPPIDDIRGSSDAPPTTSACSATPASS